MRNNVLDCRTVFNLDKAWHDWLQAQCRIQDYFEEVVLHHFNEEVEDIPPPPPPLMRSPKKD